MKWLIAIIAVFVSIDAHAQIAGTFKISKVAHTTTVEQIVFNTDGTADVTYGDYGPSFVRFPKESRGRYVLFTLEKALTVETRPTYLTKLRSYEGLGYDTFIAVTYPVGDGERFVGFVKKGNELVNTDSSEIFRKSSWWPF